MIAQTPTVAGLEIKSNDLLERGKLAWFNAKGDIFAYTKFDEPPPPQDITAGVVVHPDDYQDLLVAIARGDFST